MTTKSKKSAANKKAADSNDRMELKALNNLAGKYLLPYGEGQTFTIDAKRGKELIDNKDAVLAK